MAGSTRVLIVDEDLDSRVETRKTILRARLDVCGEVGFGTEAVTTAEELRPDVLLVAVEEPVTRPLETVEALANVLPETPVIFYASRSEPEAVRRAVIYGARDYLVKPLQAVGLAQAVIRALEFEEKRQMRQAGQLAATPVRGTVITVAGAKGGIGKSIVAVNLALALRIRTGSKVVIVDADTHFGDVSTMLDVSPQVTAAELLRALPTVDRTRINDYLTAGPNGLMLLAGSREDSNVWEDASRDSGRKIVELLSLSHDVIVVDTSGAMDSFVRELADASTLVLMVTTGEVSSVRDTKLGLARLNAWNVPMEKVKLILNRGARADGFQVADLETTLERPVFWELPRDKEVGRSVQLGRPIVIEKPGTPAARNIMALASAIGGNIRKGLPVSQHRTGGLFSRLRGGSAPAAKQEVTS
jgi:pilus assembly protein CpaE